MTTEPRTGTGLPAMHPGELLREEILPALGRPRAEIAHLLGVSRQALHAILTERASVSPEMALRLGKLCGNGPELWLALQARYDLERLRRERSAEIRAIPTVPAVGFPFVRDRLYRIGELRAFETQLRGARQGDCDLTEAIRGRKLKWAKLWTEEMFPFWLYANQSRLRDDDEFRIMPEGHAIDLELRARSGMITRFQITTAHPDWDVGRKDAHAGGYIRHMERAGINQGAPIFGGRRISKDARRQIRSEPRVRSPDVHRRAWQSGLIKAIQSKINKSVRYDGTIDVLLVYAERLRFDTINEQTKDIVLPAINIVLEGRQLLPFTSLIVLDQDPMAYVVYPDNPDF